VPISQIKFKGFFMDYQWQGTHSRFFVVFGDNIGEDGLYSQLTYKINIYFPYYKACIAPNPKILNDLKPSKEQLEKFMGYL
jgi:hypothetical protein